MSDTPVVSYAYIMFLFDFMHDSNFHCFVIILRKTGIFAELWETGIFGTILQATNVSVSNSEGVPYILSCDNI